MRPTDSSLALPRILVGAFGVLALAAIVTALWPEELVLGRAARLPGEAPRTAAQQLFDEEDMQWPQLVPWYALTRQGGRPRMVVVTDSGVHGGRALSRGVFRDRWCAQQLQAGFECYRVLRHDPGLGPDAAGADSVMAHFGVTTLPTILFLNADGVELGRIEGYPGRDAVMAQAFRWARFDQAARAGG
jgi:hypothetical protein